MEAFGEGVGEGVDFSEGFPEVGGAGLGGVACAELLVVWHFS